MTLTPHQLTVLACLGESVEPDRRVPMSPDLGRWVPVLPVGVSLAPGLWRFEPTKLGLQLADDLQALADERRAMLGQSIAAMSWREAWRYGWQRGIASIQPDEDKRDPLFELAAACIGQRDEYERNRVGMAITPGQAQADGYMAGRKHQRRREHEQNVHRADN